MSVPPQTRQYATFHIDDLLLGIEAVRVQEILRPQEMTPVPLAPPAIAGLINLRGRIVIAVDARRSLGLPRMADEHLRPGIVIRSEGAAVSLLIDRVGDVMDVPLDTWVAVPENVPPGRREWIEGVFDLKQGLLLALDTDRFLQNACLSQPETQHKGFS